MKHTILLFNGKNKYSIKMYEENKKLRYINNSIDAIVYDYVVSE